MILYVCQGNSQRQNKGEELIKKALSDYSCHKYETVIIKRTENGKPFFENIPIHFSISHSGGLWVCLMADSNVGVDIQTLRPLKYDKVAERFFTKEEVEYIKKNGGDSFFQIWVRKEAYVKYTGKGFANQGFATFTTVAGGNLAKEIREKGEAVGIEEMFLPLKELGVKTETEIFGAICGKTQEKLLIKKL